MHDFGCFPAFASDEIRGIINFLNDFTLSLVKRLPLGRPLHNSTGVIDTNRGPLLEVSWPGFSVVPPARAVSCGLQVVPNQALSSRSTSVAYCGTVSAPSGERRKIKSTFQRSCLPVKIKKNEEKPVDECTVAL